MAAGALEGLLLPQRDASGQSDIAVGTLLLDSDPCAADGAQHTPKPKAQEATIYNTHSRRLLYDIT